MDRGLLQEQVATEIGVDKTTICLWETNRVAPAVRNVPAIVRFLGYTPYRTPGHFGDWLHMVRTALGVSEKAGARLLNVDETTLAKWERGRHYPMMVGTRLASIVLFAQIVPQNKQYRDVKVFALHFRVHVPRGGRRRVIPRVSIIVPLESGVRLRLCVNRVLRISVSDGPNCAASGSL